MRHVGFACCPFLLLMLLPVELPGQGGKAKVTAKELRTLLEDIRTKHDVPALGAGIVRGGQKTIVAVVGVRKRGTEIAARDDDVWHLGSNTKPMTALLLALLIEAGLLDWDTPLSQLFPDLADDWSKEMKKITPTHLLTHTAGLPANWPLGWWLFAQKGTPAEQRANMMKSLKVLNLQSKPGTEHLYSNLGYTVIGAIIDRVGKASWEDQIEKKIFQPLGIKHAGFGPTNKTSEPLQPWPHRKNGDPAPVGGTMDNPPIMNPAGRVHMSLADYGRFLAETLRLARGEKGLLKPATVSKLFSNPHPVSPHSLSAWGGFRKQPGAKGLKLGHDGSNTSNYCTAIIPPDDNLAVYVCCNQGAPAGQKACVALRKLLVEREKS
jgi:CubicO group peptidase (beta-lactamase class C family)